MNITSRSPIRPRYVTALRTFCVMCKRAVSAPSFLAITSKPPSERSSSGFRSSIYSPKFLAYADRATATKAYWHQGRASSPVYAEERGARPQDTIIIGNTVEEIEIARSQGLISIAITGGCVSEKRLRARTGPHHIIHSLHELKPILEERQGSCHDTCRPY